MNSESPAVPAAPLLCLDDVMRAAEAIAPAALWDFVEGGGGRELSLRANRAALNSLYLIPRVLRGVSATSTAGTLVATPAAMPLAIAPMAYQRLLHPEGELATARAAKLAGVPFTVAMFSSVTVERIAESGAVLWFQMYWLRDRGKTAEMLSRAEDAGCRAVVLTVDVPRLGRRLRDLRNGFALPPSVRAVHFDTGKDTAAHRRDDGSLDVSHYVDMFDPGLTWSDLEWLRARTRLPVVLKGILAPEDAVEAARIGVEALVVSNHGGRQLDGAIAGIAALPAIRESVGETCELLVDGAIRSGPDILKAIALGASGVLLGRPVLHALIVAGEAGVSQSLSLLRDDLDDALALTGCRHIRDAADLRLARNQPL